jgi:hypothetical protein
MLVESAQPSIKGDSNTTFTNSFTATRNFEPSLEFKEAFL